MPALDAAEIAALEHDYRTGATRLLRQRSHIVLLATQLDTQAAIARVVRCSRPTVGRTLQLYLTGGRAALPRRPRSHPAASGSIGTRQQAVAAAMEQGPEACGVPRPTWTAPLLAEHLAETFGVRVSERTVRRDLAALHSVCRRGTWSVRHKAEEQPDYVPKRTGSKRS